MERDAILLDGSMGHEFKRRAVTSSFASAMLANAEQPELVTAVHAEYVAAGCDVLTTNTFTLTPHALDATQHSSELPRLLHAACDCAIAATRTTNRQVLIAGCLPPLRHCYLPELVGPSEVMRAQYELLVRELAPRVDLFLAETLCHATEVEAALQAAGPSGKPCWLAVTLHDDCAGPPRLRGGEPLATFVSGTLSNRRAPIPSALLVNCCAPQVVTRALQSMTTVPPGIDRLGGYANGFQTSTSKWLFECGAAQQGCNPALHDFACPTCATEYDASGEIDPLAYCTHAQIWMEHGATIIGGCCGVGPAHMSAIANRAGLDRRGQHRPSDDVI